MKNVTANMAGTLINVLVQVGDTVSAGQDVVVMESMKMEVPLQAETDGKVVEIKANIGDFVNEGDVILILE